MTKKLNDQKGFTLVEIMMVVIIIGILATLGIPRFQRFLLEARLSEANVNYNAIKGGESKWHNNHNQEYRSIFPGSKSKTGVDDGATHDNINTVIQRKLRIELGAEENFRYYITAKNDDANKNNSGFVVQACITKDGADEFSTEPYLSVWYVFPPEKAPKTEEWDKGWYDWEFFDDEFEVEGASAPAGLEFFEITRYECKTEDSK